MFWNIVSKIKEMGTKKFLIYLSIFITAIVLISFSLSFGNSYATKMISDLVKQNMNTIQENYDSQMKNKDKEIKELQEQIDDSIARQNDLQSKINKVEKDIYGKKIPATSQELRDRFSAVGFTPISSTSGR